MKRIVALGIGLTCFSLAANADDADVEKLLDAKRCSGCHHMTEVLIGPPYVAIASRHAATSSGPGVLGTTGMTKIQARCV